MEIERGRGVKGMPSTQGGEVPFDLEVVMVLKERGKTKQGESGRDFCDGSHTPQPFGREKVALSMGRPTRLRPTQARAPQSWAEEGKQISSTSGTHFCTQFAFHPFGETAQ
jgi:hypothetical protein